MLRRLSARLLESPECSSDDDDDEEVAVVDRPPIRCFRSVALGVLVCLRFRAAGKRRISANANRKVEMSLNKRMGEDEAAFHQQLLNSPGLMNRTVDFVRQLVEESLSKEAMNLVVGILHKMKVNTLRACWNQYIAPTSDTTTKSKEGYATLKARFQEMRVAYLKEISALRDATRMRTNPLAKLDTTIYFGPEHMTASKEESEYLHAAVVEMVKVVFDTNPDVQKTIDVSQLHRLQDCIATEGTEALERELKKARAEIRELRTALEEDSPPPRTRHRRLAFDAAAFESPDATAQVRAQLQRAEELISVQGEKLRQRTAHCQELETKLEYLEDQKTQNERRVEKYKSDLRQLHIEKDLLQQSSHNDRVELQAKLDAAEAKLGAFHAKSPFNNHAKNFCSEPVQDLPDRPPPEVEVPPEEAIHNRVTELQAQCHQLEEQQSQLQELLRQHLQTTLTQSAEEAIDDADNLLKYTSLLGGFPADDANSPEMVSQQEIKALTSELQEVSSCLGDAQGTLQTVLMDHNMASTEQLLSLDKQCMQLLQSKRCIEAKLLIARVNKTTQAAVTDDGKLAEHSCKECSKLRQELEATQALLAKVQEVSSEIAMKLKRSTGECLEQNHRLGACNQSVRFAAQSLVSSKLFQQQAQDQTEVADPELKMCVQRLEEAQKQSDLPRALYTSEPAQENALRDYVALQGPKQQAVNKMSTGRKKQPLFDNVKPQPLSQPQWLNVQRLDAGNADLRCEPSDLELLPGEPLADDLEELKVQPSPQSNRMLIPAFNAGDYAQSSEKPQPVPPRSASKPSSERPQPVPTRSASKPLRANILNSRDIAIAPPPGQAARRFSKGTPRRIHTQEDPDLTRRSSVSSCSSIFIPSSLSPQALSSPVVTSHSTPATPAVAASPRGNLGSGEAAAAGCGKAFFSMTGDKVVCKGSPSNLPPIRLQSL